MYQPKFQVSINDDGNDNVQPQVATSYRTNSSSISLSLNDKVKLNTLPALLEYYFKPLISYSHQHAKDRHKGEPWWLYREQFLLSIDFWSRIKQCERNVNEPYGLLAEWLIILQENLPSVNGDTSKTSQRLGLANPRVLERTKHDLLALAASQQVMPELRLYATSIVTTLLLRDGEELVASNAIAGTKLLLDRNLPSQALKLSSDIDINPGELGKNSFDSTKPLHEQCYIDLRYACFTGLNANVDLRYQDLTGTILTAVDCISALLNYTNLSHCRFEKSQFIRASFEYSVLFCTKFVEVDLSGALFDRATFYDCEILHCTLSSDKAHFITKFNDTHMRKVKFSNRADLPINGHGIQFKQACLFDVTFEPKLSIPRNHIEAAQFDQSIITVIDKGADDDSVAYQSCYQQILQELYIGQETQACRPRYWPSEDASSTVKRIFDSDANVDEKPGLRYILTELLRSTGENGDYSMKAAEQIRIFLQKWHLPKGPTGYEGRLGSIEITSIECNCNSKLWQEYQKRKSELVDVLSAQDVASNPLIYRHWHDTRRAIPVLNTMVGECWLFHGTSEAAMPAILDTGFEKYVNSTATISVPQGALERVRGEGALGRGQYLTDSLPKAITYFEPEPENTEIHKILLCRVLLGKVKIMRGTEFKYSNHYQGDYNSVWGIPSNNTVESHFDCNEFLIPGERSVDFIEKDVYPTLYPEFILSYRHHPILVKNTRAIQKKIHQEFVALPDLTLPLPEEIQNFCNKITSTGYRVFCLDVIDALKDVYRVYSHKIVSDELSKEAFLKLQIAMNRAHQNASLAEMAPEITQLSDAISRICSYRHLNISRSDAAISCMSDSVRAFIYLKQALQYYNAYQGAIIASDTIKQAVAQNQVTLWASAIIGVYSKTTMQENHPQVFIEKAFAYMLMGWHKNAATTLLQLEQLELDNVIFKSMWTYAINLMPKLTVELIVHVLNPSTVSPIQPIYIELLQLGLSRAREISPAEWQILFEALSNDRRLLVGLIVHRACAKENNNYKHIEKVLTRHILESYAQLSRSIGHHADRLAFIELLKSKVGEYPFLVPVIYECGRMLNPVGDCYNVDQINKNFYDGLQKICAQEKASDGDDDRDHPEFSAEIHYFDQQHQKQIRKLSLAVLAQIIEENGPERGHIKKIYTNQEGKANHNVAKIDYQGIQLFVKERPNHAMMDYAASRLRNRLAGHGSPPSTCARIYATDKRNGSKISYPVLLSLSVGDVSFSHLAEDEQHLSLQLEPEHLLRLAMADTLVMPGDLELRNSIVSPIPGTDNLKIEVIDNEQALVEPIIRETKLFANNKKLLVKNWYWCLEQLNHLTITHNIRREWLNFKVPDLLKAWLDECQAQAMDYLQLFTQEEQIALDKEKKDWPLKFNFLVRPGLIVQLLIDLTRIQGCLQQTQTISEPITFMSFLQRMQTRVHQWYHPISIKKISLKEKLKQLDMQVSASLTASASEKNYLRTVPTSEEVIINDDCTIKKAWDEFNSFYRDAICFLTLKSEKAEGDKEVHDLNYHYQLLVNNAEVKNPTGAAHIKQAEQAARKAQQHQQTILSIFKRWTYRSFTLTHSTILDDEMLLGILENSKQSLVSLDVSHCQKLTEKSFMTIILSFPHLTKINYSFTAVNKISGDILKLTDLSVDKCTKLMTIDINSPMLTQLNAANCTQLAAIKTQGSQLAKVSLKNCELVNEAGIAHLATQSGNLRSIDLIKTQISHREFREDYPYLVMLPLENVSKIFVQKLKTELDKTLGQYSITKANITAATAQKIYNALHQHLEECQRIFVYVTANLRNWIGTVWPEAVDFLGQKEAVDYYLDKFEKTSSLLLPLLKDSDWSVRSSAATALGQVAANPALPPAQLQAVIDGLCEIRKEPYHPNLRGSTATALGQVAANPALPPAQLQAVIDGLCEFLEDSVAYVRGSAASALSQITVNTTVPQTRFNAEMIRLCKLLKDPDPYVRSSTATALGRAANPTLITLPQFQAVMAHLFESLKDPESSVQESAVIVLGPIAANPTLMTKDQFQIVRDSLCEVLNKSVSNVRGSAATALGQIVANPTFPQVQLHALIGRLCDLLMLENADSYIQRSAATALGQIASNPTLITRDQFQIVIDSMYKLLNDSEPSVRHYAAKTFSQVASNPTLIILPLFQSVIDRLCESLEYHDEYVRQYAAIALGQIAANPALLQAQLQAVISALSESLKDLRSDVRHSAITALGQIITNPTLPQTPLQDVRDHLSVLLQDADSYVRHSAAEALMMLAKKQTLQKKIIDTILPIYPRALSVLYSEDYLHNIIDESLRHSWAITKEINNKDKTTTPIQNYNAPSHSPTLFSTRRQSGSMPPNSTTAPISTLSASPTSTDPKNGIETNCL